MLRKVLNKTIANLEHHDDHIFFPKVMVIVYSPFGSFIALFASDAH
uniref:Uncharacterized protein n=1 Tax=Arundo donax TaxID=35708 RepID=A0A0A9B6I8_ARUDO